MKLLNVLIVLALLFPFNLHAEVLLNQCNESDIKGSFNLIIYSNSFINDPETFIILDRGDQIKIIPYAPNFKYRVIENLNEKEALKITNEILKDNSFVSFIKCSEISFKGKNVGYELKPIYFPWVFGLLEPVETVYKKEGDSILIFIRLNPNVERQLYFGGDTERDN
ncbi:hypothetical protein [Thermodesulfovibrio sp.]|uniref:hypothetical protein n=1 Tax=Thermodesulfovibrio sp. TaxID=2067987 RepID=UPI003C7E23FF